MIRTLAACAATLAFAAPALADNEGWEIRGGVTAHDLSDHVEDGPNVTVGLATPSLGGPDWMFNPRGYLYGSFNTNGLTNFGGFGLEWDGDLTDRVAIILGLGLTYNDGVTDIDPNSPPSDPNRIRLATTRSLMGSHILFHTTLGLEFEVTEAIVVRTYYEHISHGQILASGRNQALDNAGVMIGWRFGG